MRRRMSINVLEHFNHPIALIKEYVRIQAHVYLLAIAFFAPTLSEGMVPSR